MFYIVKYQRSTFSIFKPLLCRLVTSNIEVPNLFWYVAEVLLFVNPYFFVFPFEHINLL